VAVFPPEEKQCHPQTQSLIFKKGKILLHSKKLKKAAGFENNIIFKKQITFFRNFI